MVMAHAQFDQLEKLLRALDHPRNDIYLHVDSKAIGYNPYRMTEAVTKGQLHLVSRLDVRWGSFSEIECELALLKIALSTPHDFYHLISGMDLPLRDVGRVLTFFDERRGQEFVHFSPESDVPATAYRISLHHPLQPHLGRGRAVVVASKILTRLQRGLNVNRLRKHDVPLALGSQWFSITEDLARAVVSREPWIREHFRRAVCASELFLQSVVIAEGYRGRVSSLGNLRRIDWSRGDGAHPYVWRVADLDELLAAPEMFARKFDARVDGDVIDAICRHVQPA